MRTTIEIDDRLMRRAMKAGGGFRTKRETVEAALKLIVRQAKQRKFLDLLGKVNWKGDLDAWRRD